jgi:hypothetical protein
MDVYKYIDTLHHEGYKDKYCDYGHAYKLEPIIIPYSTDGFKTFTFDLINGSVIETDDSTSLGFCSFSNITIEPTQVIDGTAGNGIIAFTAPRSGCIESLAISASINTPTGILAEVAAYITAQLYKAECNSSIFKPIPETKIVLAPSVNLNTTPGTVLNGIKENINSPLKVQDHLALVFSAILPAGVQKRLEQIFPATTPSGIATLFSFDANLSGGLTIL